MEIIGTIWFVLFAAIVLFIFVAGVINPKKSPD